MSLSNILILDEVLSVGDESFKNKPGQRIEQFWNANATVLVVSNDLEFIKDGCHQAICLDRGKIKFPGNAYEVVEYYLKNMVTTKKNSLILMFFRSDCLIAKHIYLIYPHCVN